MTNTEKIFFVSGLQVKGRTREVAADRILMGLRNGPITLATVKRAIWLCVGTEYFDVYPERAHAMRVLKRWKRIFGGEQ